MYLLLAPTGPAHQGSLGQAKEAQKPQIAVHMSLAKRFFDVGEPIVIDIRISNVGESPVIVGNYASTVSGGVSRLEFELRDSHGRLSPATQMIADNFGPRPSNDETASKLLGSFVLLRPGYSLVVKTSIDASLLSFLGKPGRYRLSATYASGGLEYPPLYHNLGLTDEAVKSLPFSSWSGKVSTNTVSFDVVPSK
jgi:hypothetical protein